jgi:ankyrin repeat protein
VRAEHSSANGIEHTRQWQSPANASDIARAVLAAGADPDATCDVYGGGDSTTPLCLLVSSGPPDLAGVQDALVEVLCNGGANPDGLGGQRPLWTAILFGYSRSAERLAACGASVDNIVFAAALGNLDLVKSYVAAGRERLALPPSAQRIGSTGPALLPDRMLEYALIYASGHARVDVVEYLLSLGPDLTVKEPTWGSTAIGWAKRYREFNPRLDDKEATIRLLEAHGVAGGT